MSVAQNHFQASVASDSYVPYEVETIAGDPQAEVSWLRDQSGGDGILYAGLFRASPSTFSYEFAGDETFHLIDGEIEVNLDSGETVTVLAGEIASFTKGTKSTWKVVAPMRKFFVISG